MAEQPTSVADGSQTASLGTEHTIYDSSAAGVYAFRVDLNNMADGDFLELRVYEMVRSGGTRRVAYKKSFQNAQPADDLIADTVLIWTDLSDSGAVRFTLKQTVGTGRAYPYKVAQF